MSLTVIALAALFAVAVALAAVVWLAARKFRDALKQERAVTSDAMSLLWHGVRGPADVLFFTSSGSAGFALVLVVLGLGALFEKSAEPWVLAAVFIISAVLAVGGAGAVAYYKLFDKLKDAARDEQDTFLAANGYRSVAEEDTMRSFPVHAEAAEGNAPDTPAFRVKRVADGALLNARFALRNGQVSLKVTR